MHQSFALHLAKFTRSDLILGQFEGQYIFVSTCVLVVGACCVNHGKAHFLFSYCIFISHILYFDSYTYIRIIILIYSIRYYCILYHYII